MSRDGWRPHIEGARCLDLVALIRGSRAAPELIHVRHMAMDTRRRVDRFNSLLGNVFRFGFERGFIFSSVNFDGTSAASPFPVGHLLWNLAHDEPLEDQAIEVDVFDNKRAKDCTQTLGERAS